MATEQTAQTARAEAGAVAGTVKDEAKNVAQEAQQQVGNTLHQVQDDVRARANEEATKVAQTLHDTSRQLQTMAGAVGGQGVASSLVRQGSEAAERLASRLEHGGVDAVMADARAFARRRPGAFLLGAATVGFVAGRLVRNLNGGNESTPGGMGNGHRAMPASNDTGATFGSTVEHNGGTGGPA